MNPVVHLHPSLVHFPIALLLVGSLAALLHLHRPGAAARVIDLRRTAWLLLGLGWLSTLPAILSGLLAQSGLPPDAPFREPLNWHTGTAIALALLYGLILYRAWLFQGAKARKARVARRTRATEDSAENPAENPVGNSAENSADLLDHGEARLWLTAALLGGMALILATGWNGGVLVYEWAVNVNS